MKVKFQQLGRYGRAAVGLAFIILFCSLPFLEGSASAALVTSRSITMSNSTAAATGVTYKLTFTPITTAQELIVDFCSDTPIIGATCAYANTTVPVVTSATSSAGTITFPGSQGHTIKVTGLTMTGGSPYTITFSNVTNPTTVVSSFYARILTYPTGDGSEYVPATSSGGSTTVGANVTDSGGDALATAQVISVTATVMEQLTFCVSGLVSASPPTTCTSTTSPAVTLGSGSPLILGSGAVSTGNAYTLTSTNALHGVSVAMKDTSSTTCGGLSSNGGSTCSIPAVNTSGSSLPSAATITAGTAAVGMCITPNTANTIASQPYNSSGCTQYGMDQTTDSSPVIGTYGSPVFTTTSAVNSELDTLTFAATASNTTPAGVYTANYALIATGTF